MKSSPIGGKTILCSQCSRETCPFSAFSAKFQLRICPTANDLKESQAKTGKPICKNCKSSECIAAKYRDKLQMLICPWPAAEKAPALPAEQEPGSHASYKYHGIPYQISETSAYITPLTLN